MSYWSDLSLFYHCFMGADRYDQKYLYLIDKITFYFFRAYFTRVIPCYKRYTLPQLLHALTVPLFTSCSNIIIYFLPLFEESISGLVAVIAFKFAKNKYLKDNLDEKNSLS